MRAYLNTRVTASPSGWPPAQPPSARSQTMRSDRKGSGTRPLALEIQDDEARLGAERLAQVVVAVDADLHTVLGAERLELARPGAQRGFAGEQRPRVVRDLVRDGGEASPDCVTRPADVLDDAPDPRGHVGGSGRLGREGRVCGVGGERDVQRSRHDAQAGELAEDALGQLIDTRRRELPQMTDDPAPAVALVRDISLEQAERRHLARRGRIPDRPGQRWHAGKPVPEGP